MPSSLFCICQSFLVFLQRVNVCETYSNIIKGMKLKSFLIGICLLCSAALSAQEWIDLTDAYVVNPRFDGNAVDGWTLQGSAPTKATGYEGFEFWNGTFGIQQTVQLPMAGKFRVSVQAYFRHTTHEWALDAYQQGTDPKTAFFYANDVTTPIVSIYAEPSAEYVHGAWSNDGQNYYPNNMETGAYFFSQGAYQNQLEVELPEAGNLTFGLRCEEWYDNMWCMMDNFKLEYYGTRVNVSQILLSSKTLNLNVGEEQTLKTTVVPSNALFQTLTWTSSNPAVASVDAQGRVMGQQVGVAVITAEATDGSGVKASATVIVKKLTASAQTIIINELQAANLDMYVDPSFNYGTWVELYNPTSQTVSLQGCYVSDDPANLKKHRLTSRAGVVPAKGYKVLWFDHHSKWALSQIDDKLDYDGGTFCISDENGVLIGSQTYPEAISRTSYARTTDGGAEWGITATPTPGRSNVGSVFTTNRLEVPPVNKDACLFTSAMNVQVTIPQGATLRYTTDGTTPTENNGQVSANGVFRVTETTVFRFRLFQDGYLPSRVVTRSYIYKDREYDLPIVSVVTDPEHLYDDSLGIMVQGKNGRTGNGQRTPCNWNMDWDRPVNFEYLTVDGKMAVNMEANMEMCGGWSRAWSPHSFKIKANKIYEGENYIPYQIFPNKAYMKHKTLQIRNGGNDTDCRIKDAALQAIVHTSGLDIDGQECQPVVHFINGEYKGLLNIREPNNKHFVEANYALDEDEIDQFEMSPDSGYVQKCGTDESFLRWYDLSANAADAATYEEICGMVDMDEYINYMAVEFYLGGTDWPQNNIKGFKPRVEGGKFRFVLFDLDGAFAATDVFTTFGNKQTYTFDLIYDTNSRLTAEIKWVTIFKNMLKNDEFRKQFIDTYCLVAGSVFETNRCNAIIDSMAQNIELALSFEWKSPWSTANTLKSQLKSRPQQMINALKNYYAFKLSGVTEQKVSLASNIPQARLRVNGMEVPTGKFGGSLFAPITLKAEAPAGYRFLGWKSGGSVTSKVVIPQAASWSYYDQGSQDGKGWQLAVTAGWSTGQAPLGYFTSDANNGRGYNTFLDYGNDAGNKRPTYYFCREFTLDHTPSQTDTYTLNYTVDDGMVVYVNGQEAARYLMPDGTVGYNTYASSYAEGNPDAGSLQLPAKLFKQGTNVIAVEVHNNNGSSTDIYFDASLTVDSPLLSTEDNYLSTEPEMVMPADKYLNLVACYEAVPEEEMKEAHAVPVRINEVSADNSIYVNATYFKKNDWIELYNTTGRTVDVAGMYLSDKESNPYKYQIPTDGGVSTLIPPYGYLIVWADKLEPVQQLHTTFKLDNEGGCVMLTAADESWQDILHYPSHAGDKSVGLYPDGGMHIYLMNTPSIAASNFITSYAEYLSESVIPDAVEQMEMADGARLYAAYADGQLMIIGEGDARVSVALYGATGQYMTQLSVMLVGGRAVVPMNELATGIYVVRMQDENGNICNQKLIVR